MAEARCSSSSEHSEVELRMDKAFQIFWEKLEALMFPTTPEKAPGTRPRTRPSVSQRKPAQTAQAPSRQEKRNQWDTIKKRATRDPSGGNRRKATATSNRQVTMRTHISPPGHQPDTEGQHQVA
ncbi:Hypothetical predicted protein [Pelobates cultripes]|uniref:Uncharacterized protein n=1 Tax=Pelobates cultripes TaxID=61616 RepID=A0AAD1WBE9_PELCU|nr:Hypothetical predicted protein [Pelobates cultripes]